MSPIKFLNNRPWIYVVLAFAILIAAWTTLIVIAVKNRKPPLPEEVGLSAPTCCETHVPLTRA